MPPCYWTMYSGWSSLDHVSLKSEQLKIENFWYSGNIDSPRIGNFKNLVTLTIPEFKNVKPPLASFPYLLFSDNLHRKLLCNHVSNLYMLHFQLALSFQLYLVIYAVDVARHRFQCLEQNQKVLMKDFLVQYFHTMAVVLLLEIVVLFEEQKRSIDPLLVLNLDLQTINYSFIFEIEKNLAIYIFPWSCQFFLFK